MKPVNRVLLAFKAWDDQKNEMQPLLKNGMNDEATLKRLQLVHLQQCKQRLRDSCRPDERPFMALLNNQINKLEKQLYPNALIRLYMQLKEYLIDGPAYLKKAALQRTANMESLKVQLRERGLSSVAGQLEHHLNADHKQVCLPLHGQLGPEKRLNLDLHFEKDVYGNFQLYQLEGTLLQKNQDIQHYRFEFSDWPGLKATQALSLLEGRALKQTYTDATGQISQRWVELGSKGAQYYPPDHFDLSDAMAAFPQLTRNREELIRYLENGQLISTHWKQEGQFQNISVKADPANRTLQFYDDKNKPVTAEQLGRKAQQFAKAQRPESPVKQIKKGIRNGHHV